MAAPGEEITMTEAMTEGMMTVTITADLTEEVAAVAAAAEDGELPKIGIRSTGEDHHPHTTAEEVTDLAPDLDPIHLVAIET